MATPSLCKVCGGTGWLCEEHPDKPMDHDGCRGAGMPCRACNPADEDNPPRLPKGMKTVFDKDGWRH